ncbi:hypothetical protein L3Y34_012031 [Caenorhabditis briggsae]|uniref:Uncharacterized protein n=1 Tax=Caenorhabditis briggsae TaxID=6238 RepID=A0AAE9CW25_CAEBR|nr:hypothetical protein L3Y34_012031 [Caenorhabditis briggsae]
MGSSASKNSVQLQPKVIDIKQPGTSPNEGGSLPATLVETQKPSKCANRSGISSQMTLSSEMYSQNAYDNYGFCAGLKDHEATLSHAVALRLAPPVNHPHAN